MPNLFRDRWLRHLHRFLQRLCTDELTKSLYTGPFGSAPLIITCFASGLDIGSLVDEIGRLDEHGHRNQTGIDVTLTAADFTVDVGKLG